MFYAVFVVSLGLLITEPFVGYLDQVFSLLLLSAALSFLPRVGSSWAARLGLGALLVATGLSHPPTLAIFAATLGAGIVWDAVVGRRGAREALRVNRPLILTLLVSLLVVLTIWKAGVWGRSSAFSEAAALPDQDPEQLLGRLRDWVASLYPVLNGPLLVAGLIGVVVTAKRPAHDALTRWSVAWLLPLAGLAGFAFSSRFPFYRFLNATAAWTLLVGAGAYFVVRLALRSLHAPLILLATLVGASVAVAATFTTWSAALAVWNRPDGRWLGTKKRQNLEELRAQLAAHTDPDRPVVFVLDDEPATRDPHAEILVQDHSLRYGVPAGQIDRVYFYLGGLQAFLGGRPSPGSDPRYGRISSALLDTTRRGIQAAGRDPVVVLEAASNREGRNRELVRRPAQASAPLARPGGAEVWVVRDGRVTRWLDGRPVLEPIRRSEGAPPRRHALWVALGLALLLVPGALAVKSFSPASDFLEALALIAPLALSLITLSAVAVLAVARAPLAPHAAWLSLAAPTAGAAGVYALRRARSPAGWSRRGRVAERRAGEAEAR